MQRAPLGSATKSILVILWIAFAIEVAAAKSFSPSAPMLYALGGVSRGGVGEGGFHRLLTASLLHGGFVHILFNSLALFSSGRILESRVGAMCTYIVFTVGALGGACASVLLNDPRIVSVGASGAIMGVAGAAGVVSFSMPKGPERSGAQGYLVQALVFNLLPLAGAIKGESKVDYGAHLGGAIAGALVGALFLVLSKMRSKEYYALPLGPRTGAVFAALCGMAYVFAGGRAALAFPKEAAVAQLSASDVLVKDERIPDANPEATVEEWGKDRPRDPRVHLYRAKAAMLRADDVTAERVLRAGLEEQAIFDAFFSDGNAESLLRRELSAVLISGGRVEEAAKVATVACALKEGPAILERGGMGYCKDAKVPVPTQGALLAKRCNEAIVDHAYVAANTLCDRALAASTQPTELADIHVGLGRLLELAKRDADAEVTFEKALSYRKQVAPQNDEELGRTEHRLAMVLDRNGKTAAAETHYREALVAYRAAGLPESHYVANVLGNLARMAERRGALAEAYTLATQALAIQEKVPEQEAATSEMLEIIAHILRAQGKGAEADQVHRRALALQPKQDAGN